MRRALSITAGLLAVLYLFSGSVKVILPKKTLAAAPGGGWVNDFRASAVKTIGVLEILGALGLILPAALGIAPVLAPLAAAGLAVLMAGAVFTRIRRREPKPMVADLVYLALTSFVAWGRRPGSATVTR